MRLRLMSTSTTRTLTNVAGLDHLMGVLDETVGELGYMHQPVLWTPMSTKAPKAATLVTVPSSSMPGFRSLMSSTPSAKGRGAEAGARVAAGFFQLGDDVAHRGQAEALVHEDARVGA